MQTRRLLAFALTSFALTPTAHAAEPPDTASDGDKAAASEAAPGTEKTVTTEKAPTGTPSAETPAPPETPSTTAPDATSAPDATVLRQQTRAKDLRLQAQELAKTGQLERAAEKLRAALEAYPAYPLALNELGAIFTAQSDFVRAKAVLEQALALDPTFIVAKANLAEVLRRLNDLDAAALAYKDVLATAADDATSHYGLGYIFDRQEKPAQALWAFERYLVLQLDQNNPLVADVNGRVNALKQAGVVAAAPTWGSGTREPGDTPKAGEPLKPGELSAHDGDIAYYEQRYGDALKAYTSALAATKEGDTTTLRYKIGATHAVMRDYRQAMHAWRALLVDTPDRELVIRHLAMAAGKLRDRGRLKLVGERTADALADARGAMRDGDPGTALWHLSDAQGADADHLRAEAHLALGDLASARDIFGQLIAANADDVRAKGGLAEALLRAGADGPAQQAMEAWLGEREAHPDEFLVMRVNEAEASLINPPEADAPPAEDLPDGVPDAAPPAEGS